MTTQTTTTEIFTPYNGTRTDIHRPSAINPADYTYVAIEYLNPEGDIRACHFLNHNREIIRQHMAETGGKWSNHQHGGNCHVCGAHAIYTVGFYHAATNTYIRTGMDCAEKMDMADAEMFRTHRAITAEVANAREYARGVKKAQAVLAEAGLMDAWKFYAEPDSNVRAAWKFEEATIADIVGKLVKYGSVSEKQLAFVKRLVDAIPARAEKEAAKAAEKAAAADCPTGHIEVDGVVLSIKEQETAFGYVTKMLVQHATGWKVWGTVPSNLTINKGDRVAFTATVERSADDSKFGFYSRPTKARATVVENA
jgi:hypothetical protein